MATTAKESPLVRRLRKHGACEDGLAWAAKHKTASAAWLACDQPAWMLWALEAAGLWDDRQGRLFACACARRTPLPDGRTTWDLLTDPRSRKAVEVAEAFAEGKATEDERSAAESAARSAAWSARSAWSAAVSAWSAVSAARSAVSAARSAVSAARSAARSAESAQADILREIFGNPFKGGKRLRKEGE